MMDLPIAVTEVPVRIDFERLSAAVKNYAPLLEIFRATWTRQSFSEMAEGKLFVPDEQMNDALARMVERNERHKIKSLSLHSAADGKLYIYAVTDRGELEFSGILEEFVHKDGRSVMRYRVKSKKFPHHGINSWIFSHISLSLVERMVGNLNFSEGLPVEVHGNSIEVDYSEALARSNFGKADFYGKPMTEVLEIEGAKVKEGGIEFDTKLNLPEEAQEKMRKLVDLLAS